MNTSDEVCEHCLIGVVIDSLWGPFQVYKCELDQYHGQEWLGGFEKPCEGHQCKTEKQVLRSYNHGKDKRWEWEYKFRYKRIPRDQMRKSEDCLRQEREEEAARKGKAEALRRKAMEILREADQVERGE